MSFEQVATELAGTVPTVLAIHGGTYLVKAQVRAFCRRQFKTKLISTAFQFYCYEMNCGYVLIITDLTHVWYCMCGTEEATQMCKVRFLNWFVIAVGLMACFAALQSIAIYKHCQSAADGARATPKSSAGRDIRYHALGRWASLLFDKESANDSFQVGIRLPGGTFSMYSVGMTLLIGHRMHVQAAAPDAAQFVRKFIAAPMFRIAAALSSRHPSDAASPEEIAAATQPAVRLTLLFL
jgi:hypothetical protein